MEKLEQYLDQVCRCIGGPRALRQHVRQELREHLLDAIAQHQAAGMTPPDALEQALAEFGKPEDVRSELEAAHGQRMMAVVIDKAMQWKERTMKAKWLWISWAYLALVLVIAMQTLFISFTEVFLLPKFEKLMSDGIIDPAVLDEDGPRWMFDFLNNLRYIYGHYTLLIILAALVAGGLFEWFVRSENKPFMRLSALGTLAVGLTVVVVLMAGSIVILFLLGVPAVGRMVRPWALEQVAGTDASVSALESALAKQDWKATQEAAMAGSNYLERLSAGPAVNALTTWSEPPVREDLRAQLKVARENFRAVQQALREENAERAARELQNFRQSFEPLREAAKRPGR